MQAKHIKKRWAASSSQEPGQIRLDSFYYAIRQTMPRWHSSEMPDDKRLSPMLEPMHDTGLQTGQRTSVEVVANKVDGGRG